VGRVGEYEGRVANKEEREGEDRDFLRASVPCRRGALVGQGVRGTYPVASETCPGCQDPPTSGLRPFLFRDPNIFFIVAPMDVLELPPASG